MKWVKHITLILAILALLVISLAFYGMVTPHVTDRSVINYAAYVAQFGPTDLPHTATNIRFVMSGVGLGGRAHLYKFESPIKDAKIFALTEYASYDRGNGKASPKPQFEPAHSPLTKPDLSAYGIHDLSWFDVENITEGITLPRDHTHRPFIYIDTKRNIYYSFWTD